VREKNQIVILPKSLLPAGARVGRPVRPFARPRMRGG